MNGHPMTRHAMNTTLALSCAALITAGCAQIGTKSFAPPADRMSIKTSALPGFAKAQAQCQSCHSAEYMLYQPPSAARPYWNNMVLRMKTVFKAPIADADVPELVDYLVKTYGNEQSR
jgi:hypothetical protein